MKYLLSLLFVAIGFVSNVWAQSPEKPMRMSSGELYNDLQQFANTGKVLYLAAHPDDENTRVIAYMEKYRHVQTAYLSLTRGDGGQNLIGTDIGVYLGVLRTQELLNARKKDGGQQYFTRAVDFGYSKNPDETFEHWNQDSILKDVVYVIREFKPDVIVLRFPTTGEGGHGHHTASAILAEQAFDLAADKNYNTGQAPHVTERMVWNSFSWRRSPDALKDDIEIPMGEYLPELGVYVGEIASDARSQHRCQGFGRELQRGQYSEFFKNIKGTPIKTDVLEGIDLTWARISGNDRIANMLNGIVINYSFQHPENSIAGLQMIESEIMKLPTFNGKDQKLLELQQLIVKLSGFYAEWTVDEDVLSLSKTYTTEVEYSAATPSVQSVNFTSEYFNGNKTITKGELYTEKFKLTVDQAMLDKHASDILHLKSIVNDVFQNSTANGTEAYSTSFVPQCVFSVKINGKTYAYKTLLTSKKIASDFGEKYNRALILPDVSFNITESQKIIKKGEWNTLNIKVNNRGTDELFELILTAKGLDFDVDKTYTLPSGKESTVRFRLKGTVNGNLDMDLALKSLKTGKLYTVNERHIDYEHIPRLVDTQVAQINISVLDLRDHSLKIAYLTGAGDLLAENLKNIGLDVTEISDEELLDFNPTGYDAVVAGIRIYNVSENIGKIQDKLNAYVNGGGTYIVQYNTSNFLGEPNASFSPKPMEIGRDRVTIESAPVTVLQKDHFVFNTPYAITDKSWDNWVQERGLYFGENWDKNFVPLLEMADTGEKLSQGSLLYLPYGKGHFYYSGISFFRNMPAGVEGAYQLFLNMLSSSKNNAQ